MKKPMKIFLGVVGVLALFGICFACLSLYAKKEINKPKFELPEPASIQPVSSLPSTKEAAYTYVSRLYEKCMAADDIELNRHTDVHLTDGERTSPLPDADNAILSRVLENAQGKIGEYYPVIENALMTELQEKPTLGFSANEVTDFTAAKGYTDENGETVDDGNYYITLTVNPSVIDAQALTDSEVSKSIQKELEPVFSVSSLAFVPQGYTVSFRIDYADDALTWAEVKKQLTVKASVDFTEDYRALSAETAAFEIPFETVESLDFFHYGLRFTERRIAVQKSDMKALPLEVRVNSEATKEDYKMTYTVSKDGILDIDEDGVMNVIGTQEEPVTVTATLEYDGHTYTDTLTVYATELEVKTDEP